MKKKIAKTNATRKAAKAMGPDRSGLLNGARDAEAAARMARVMMGAVSGEHGEASAIGKACARFEQHAATLEEEARNIIQGLKTGKPTIQEDAAPLTDADGMLHAHAIPLQAPGSYLVKLNAKAAANLDRLAKEHNITPEDALTVAALVMLKCGSGDCWAGDCFRELLQETNEPELQFIEAAGSVGGKA